MKGKTMIGFLKEKAYDRSEMLEGLAMLGLGVSSGLLALANLIRDKQTKWYSPENEATNETVLKTKGAIESRLVKEK